VSAKKLVGRTQVTEVNENNMLDRRFAIAPMMDWTAISQKAKYGQHLTRTSVVMSYQMKYSAADERSAANEFRFRHVFGGGTCQGVLRPSRA
jgi:hypothetical protein